MKETIFFATYRTETAMLSDRSVYFNEEKTLEQFNEWVQLTREEIEREFYTNVIVVSINFIKN